MVSSDFGCMGIISNAGIKDGQYHHIVFQRINFLACDNEHIQVFIDGTQVQWTKVWEQEPFFSTTTPGPFIIGADRSSNPLTFTETAIDELGVWQRPLTEQEVQWLYRE